MSLDLGLSGSKNKSKGWNSGRYDTGAEIDTEERAFLEIDQAGIDKIISDVLSGADGLAAIFQGEQNAGIYNSSVAAQAAGDLTTKLAGEIAKLTAQEVRKKKGREITAGTEYSEHSGKETGIGFKGSAGMKIPGLS